MFFTIFGISSFPKMQMIYIFVNLLPPNTEFGSGQIKQSFRRVSIVFSIIQKSSYPINLRTLSPIRNLNLINYFKQHTIPCQFFKKKTEGNCIFCTHPIIIKPWGSQLHETDVLALPSYTINFFLMLQKPVILSIFFHKFPKISSSSIL